MAQIIDPRDRPPTPEEEADEAHLRSTALAVTAIDRARLSIRLGKPIGEITPQDLEQFRIEQGEGPLATADPTMTPLDELQLRDKTVDSSDAQQLRGYRQTLEAEAQTNAWCARRLAEVCELLDDNQAAIQWWRHAAKLGDEAAIAYVEHCIVD